VAGEIPVQWLKYILLGILFYLAYCCFLFLIQRQILFPRYLIPSPAASNDKQTAYEKIWLETEFGRVESWFLPPACGPASKPAPAVIFGHGNGELIDYWPADLKPFTHLGIGCLLVEYPGYGRSDGKPSLESIKKTFVAAYDKLAARRDVDAKRIILFGRSLGGAAICTLAAERPSKALILMSTFTSIRSFAKKYLVPSFFIRDPFDNLAVTEAYTGPILLIHGKHDTVIPFSHGVKLHQAAPHSKFIVYNAGHNDCPPNWNQFWQDITLFLQEADIIQY
jgi:pimeloyl-ACP methyl ester carboxylesterase